MTFLPPLISTSGVASDLDTATEITNGKKEGLTLKAPITTAADDIHKYFFIVFQGK